MIYSFKGKGFAHPYDAFGFVVMRQLVDIPAILAGDEKMIDSNGNQVVPPAIVDADVLRLFGNRKGFMVMNAGMVLRSGTLNENDSIIQLGVNSADNYPTAIGAPDPALFCQMFDSAGILVIPQVSYTGTGGEAGSFVATGYNGDLWLDDGYVDLTFTLADPADMQDWVLEAWVMGFQAIDADAIDDALTPMLVP